MTQAAAAGAVLHGTVKMFKSQNGYGFVTGPDGRELFVHVRDVAGGQALAPGQRVAYRVGTSPRDGRDRAIDVRVIGIGEE